MDSLNKTEEFSNTVDAKARMGDREMRSESSALFEKKLKHVIDGGRAYPPHHF